MIFLPVVAGRIGHIWRAMLLQLVAACEQLQEARKFQKLFQELVVASPGRPLLREDGRSNKQLLKLNTLCGLLSTGAGDAPVVDQGSTPAAPNAPTTTAETRQVCGTRSWLSCASLVDNCDASCCNGLDARVAARDKRG